jgi:hypothetical protein
MDSSLLTQLPALVGVCVGALATYGTTSLAEKARWRRERAVRWDDARMRAYAEYSDAVKKVSHLAGRIAAGRGFPYSVEPLAPDAEAIEALVDADAARAGVWERVLLLGDPQTVAAARAWQQTVWRLGWFARGRLTAAEQWEPAIRETEIARDAFYDCARRDLGVKGEAVPTPAWPPKWVTESLTPGDHPEDAAN